MSDLASLHRADLTRAGAGEFVQLARTLLEAKGQIGAAQRIATARGLTPRVIEILKTGVDAVSTTSASSLIGYREISTGFAASLAPWSSYDRIYNENSFMRVPLKTRISIASSAATGSSVSELAPKPLSAMTFGLATLEPMKVSSFIVVSNELARSVSPAAISALGNELRRACAVSTDAAFLAALAESTGVTSNASTGLSAAQFSADLATALAAVTVGANSKLYLILPPAVWKSVALMRDNGGPIMINGIIGDIIRVIPSDAAEDVATLIDASQVATESDLINLMAAEHASIQMDDNPTGAATSLVSLWQNDLTGLRAERTFGVELLRTDAVALITGMSVSA